MVAPRSESVARSRLRNVKRRRYLLSMAVDTTPSTLSPNGKDEVTVCDHKIGRELASIP